MSDESDESDSGAVWQVVLDLAERRGVRQLDRKSVV